MRSGAAMNKSPVRNETRTPIHETQITEFLYDEGPSNVHEIAEYLGLAVDNTRVILNGLYEAGQVKYFRRKAVGNVLRPGTIVAYWLLAGDADW